MENNKCRQGCGKIGTLVYWLWECKMVVATVENSLAVPQKLYIELPYQYNPAILSIYPKGLKTDTCTAMFIVALFTIARRLKQPKCLEIVVMVMQYCEMYLMSINFALKKRLKLYISCYVYFATITKKFKKKRQVLNRIQESK